MNDQNITTSEHYRTLQQAALREVLNLSPEAVREAEPFVRAAREHSQRAASQLRAEELAEAPGFQREALTALADARERFLDLRGLIETTHRAERQIEQIMAADGAAPGSTVVHRTTSLR